MHRSWGKIVCCLVYFAELFFAGGVRFDMIFVVAMVIVNVGLVHISVQQQRMDQVKKSSESSWLD